MRFEQNSCFVVWNETHLTCGNALFSTTFQIDQGIRITALAANGRDWTGASPASPAGGPEFTPDGTPVMEADFSAVSAVEAPSLHFKLSLPTLQLQGKVWPGLAGLWLDLRGEDAGEAVTPQSAAPTGIELADTAKKDEDTGFALRAALRTGHTRLHEVEFRDQSDFHGELVFERQRLMTRNERVEPLRGNVWALEDVLTGAGVIFLKHAPLPAVRPNDASPGPDLTVKREAELVNCTLAPDGYAVAVLIHEPGQRVATMQQYGRALRVPHAERDGLLLSNTWGDRSCDGAVCEEFVLREAEVAARLGVDVLQIDDGWQRGTTANSLTAGGVWGGFWDKDLDFWTPHPTRFPNGLAPVKERCDELGLKLGLWFSPDSLNECAYWERDADALLGLHREYGVNFFKLDGMEFETRQAFENFHRCCAKVMAESAGKITLDLDITAERRPGYWGEPNIGPLFVENRYTDWHGYWPHSTLRTLWKLAHWIQPHRLRLEFLNNTRNLATYGDDPLAPARYAPDYLFATTMLAAPLGWFEVQNLPDSYVETVAPLVALWKQHREALVNDAVIPLGAVPDGTAWTGFVSAAGYALVFRELNGRSSAEFDLAAHGSWTQCELLAGDGEGWVTDGVLRVEIPEKLRFVWLKLT